MTFSGGDWSRNVQSRRLRTEEIEVAYVDLFGYDPRIHALFSEAVVRLHDSTRETYDLVLETTQHATLSLVKPTEGNFLSGALGNELRTVCGDLAEDLHLTLGYVTSALATELMTVATAPDRAIVDRKLPIRDPATVFQSLPPRQRPASRVLSLPHSLKGGVGRSLPVVRKGPTLPHAHFNGVQSDRDVVDQSSRVKEAGQEAKGV